MSTPSSASVGSAIGRVSSLIEVAGQRLGVGEAVLGGEGGRHGHPDDPLAAEGVGGPAATRLESMPPDRPMWTVSKPFLVT